MDYTYGTRRRWPGPLLVALLLLFWTAICALILAEGEGTARWFGVVLWLAPFVLGVLDAWLNFRHRNF